MKAKEGDIVEFLAISWEQPWWDFDYPTLVLKPFLGYSPNGTCPESMIEDMAISFCCGEDISDEDINSEFEWRHWSLPWIKRVARERLQGKDTWKTMAREVVKQKVEFYNDSDGELMFRVLETTKL